MVGIFTVICMSVVLGTSEAQAQDDTQYTSSVPGKMAKFRMTPTYDDHTLVVLKPSNKNKVGVWHNSFIFYSRSQQTPIHGCWFVNPEYDSIYLGTVEKEREDTTLVPFSKAYAVCGKLIEKKGQKHEEWQVFELGYGMTVTKGKIKEISDFTASDVKINLGNNFIAMRKTEKNGDEKWGLYEVVVKKLYSWWIDLELKEWISPKFADLNTPLISKSKFGNLVTAKKDKDGKYGIVNLKGEEIFPFEYDTVRFDTNAIIAKKGDKYGVLFEDRTASEFVYDSVTAVIPEGYVFYQNGKAGFAASGSDGRVVLNAEYEAVDKIDLDPELVSNAYDGTALMVKKEGRWGLYSPNGELVVPHSLKNGSKMLAFVKWAKENSYSFARDAKLQKIRTTRGEFETDAEFEARKNNSALESEYEAKELAGFQKEFIISKLKDVAESHHELKIDWDPYDMDKKAFPFSTSITLPIQLFEVPVEEGRAFKEALQTLKTKDILETATFFIAEDYLQIGQMTVKLPSGKSYSYTNPLLKSNTGAVVKYSDIF